MKTTDQIKDTESKHVLQLYKRQPIVLARGNGVSVFDTDGREYLDLISGIGVAALGHAHPGLADAIADQARLLMHTSNLFFHPLQGELAERLSALSGLPRAFFCNSGTEAMEACLKFVRRYWFTKKDPRRTGIVALERAFHGRTLGSLSVTHDPHYREPFEPLLQGVTWVPINDEAALQAAVSDTTAAIVIEPIQGEGGVRPLSPAFAQAIAGAAARTGALIVADEVQCGLGRTGKPFHFPSLNLQPHLVAVGKNLGAGVPIGAALVSDEVSATVSAGDHGSTFGGNLLACRAALFYLDQLEKHGLFEHVAAMGPYVERELRALQGRHPVIVDVRGAGLMWGLQLNTDAAPIVQAALTQGLLVNRTAERVVRLLPPLVIDKPAVDRGLAALDQAFATVFPGVGA